LSWFRRDEHLSEADLSAYLDGELGGRQAGARAHMERCEACRARLEELASLQAMLGGLPRPALSRSFRLPPSQAGATTRIPARRAVFTFAPAVALSLFLALVFVDVTVVDNGASQSESRTMAFNAAESLKDEDSSRQTQPAAAPSAAGGAPGLAEGAQPPPAAATPQGDVAADAAAEQAIAPAPEADSTAQNLVRGLEVITVIVFAGSLLLVLRQRRRPSR
jgi:anti-sigma factor RsiW